MQTLSGIYINLIWRNTQISAGILVTPWTIEVPGNFFSKNGVHLQPAQYVHRIKYIIMSSLILHFDNVVYIYAESS